jgi:ligand-binding sensor domain-containing protein/class 3 adenylate cyclase
MRASLQTLLALIFACKAWTTHAQRYFFENISVQQNLPASKVYAVVQDAYGTVWMGTEAGLASYDGNTIVTYGPADGAARGGVRSLLVDADGRLWAGHMDGGITVVQNARIQAHRPSDGMNAGITGIAQDGTGSIWLATAGQGAWRVTMEGNAFSAERLSAGGLREKLLGATRLKDGSMCFVEVGGGIVKLSGNTVQPLPLPGVPEAFAPTSCYQASDGALWVGTDGGGAFRIAPDGGSSQRFDPSNGMPSAIVYCFGEDAEGQVWIGTVDGGAVKVGKDGLQVFDQRRGLHSTFVRCITRDREGNLLIGTNDSGLDIFKGERFVSIGDADGLVDPQVWAVLEDRQGRTWFGTNGGILVWSDGSGNSRPETITMQQGRLTTNFIRHLREDDKGTIWIGTDNGGLLRYDTRTGKAVYDIELSGGLAENKVTALELGQTGELWVGGLNGVRRYLPGSGTVPTVYTKEEGLAGDHVLAIYRAKDGIIWVGSTVSGITRIDNGQAKVVDLGKSFTATAFVEDSEGRLWVGTEGQGIIVLKDGREVQRFTLQEGLLSNTIKVLVTDSRGQVWIGTNKGLNKWRPKKGGFIAFTERAGFTGIEVKPHAVCATRDGSIWFGTVNGASRVGGAPEQDRNVAPLVAIRGWKVNLEDRPIEADNSLSHSERSIRITYGSVALSDPGAVRYQVKLEGLDEDWQPITTASDAYYPALPPGDYVFLVKAMDRTGEWSDPPAQLNFTILPPWYRRWWFYTALAFVLGTSLLSYIKLRERQLRLRNQILERKVKERTAEVVAQAREIEGQKGRIEDLLLNILPKEISEELKDKGKATARRHEQVTVLFTDMKGFTQAAERMTPEELVNELDQCFIKFDEIVGRYRIEKIKTIGDSYMCAAGVPAQDPHHATACVLAALEVRDLMDQWRTDREAKGATPWALRIGLHSGPVVAGVVGRRKFAYDIWGDTVNTASRLESSGAPGEVNISAATYALVKDRFVCESRGEVAAKNKGSIAMYFVRGIREGYHEPGAPSRPNARFLQEIGR